MAENLININIERHFAVAINQIEKEIKEWFKKRNRPDSVLELSIVGKCAMRSLNKKFLSRDSATDVLSFPLEKIPGEKNELVGTIVICNDKVAQYAKEKDTSFEQEFVFLLRHGIDHLIGIHHKE